MAVGSLTLALLRRSLSAIAGGLTPLTNQKLIRKIVTIRIDKTPKR